MWIWGRRNIVLPAADTVGCLLQAIPSLFLAHGILLWFRWQHAPQGWLLMDLRNSGRCCSSLPGTGLGEIMWHCSTNDTKKNLLRSLWERVFSSTKREASVKKNACYVPILPTYFCSYSAKTWFLEGRQSFISKTEQAQEWKTNPLRKAVWAVGAWRDDPGELPSPQAPQVTWCLR